MAKHKRTAIMKSGGDDSYSWALFVDGRRVLAGMMKGEAEYELFDVRRKRFPDELTPAQRERLNGTAFRVR